MDLEHPLPITSQNAGPLQGPPITTSVIVWEPGFAPAPQNFNRNHERGGFFKGFINCDQPPSAVTHVIQAAVMTPSKGCPQGGRRQGGGYKGNRASEVSHLPLNCSRTPSAGGGQGQLWKITPLWSPVFGDGSWSADGSGYSLYGWLGNTERQGEREQTKLFLIHFVSEKNVFQESEDCNVQKVYK